MKASSKPGLRMCQESELAGKISLELLKVAHSAVRERVLQLLPYPFIGIKFGSIWGEVFQMKARNLLAERADHSATMGNAVVQERDDMTPKMMENLAEECRDFILADVVPEEQSV